MRTGAFLSVGLALAFAMPMSLHAVPMSDAERDHALAEIEGTVVSMDSQRQRLHIKDTVDQPVSVRVIPETRIMSSDNKDLKLSDLHPDDKVRLYYNKTDGTARQIDRLPTPGAVLMGSQ
jgi:hypothetical protein